MAPITKDGTEQLVLSTAWVWPVGPGQNGVKREPAAISQRHSDSSSCLSQQGSAEPTEAFELNS